MLGIVILNYLNWWDTVELINSITNQSYNNYHIIIVDNNSDNDSVLQLSRRYSSLSSVSLLVSDYNEGFARGNNIGIMYARNSLHVSDVLLLNNDTLLIEREYLENLMNIQYDNSVGAIGTRILDNKDQNQNPTFTTGSFKQALTGYMGKNKFLKTFRRVLFFTKNLIVGITKKNANSDDNSAENLDYQPNKKYFILHGSAILLTTNYLDVYPGVYPRTFLYFEENFLDFLLQRKHLHAEYHEELTIKHKEDQSSNLVFDDIVKEKEIILIDSWREFLKIQFMSYKKIIKQFSKYTYHSVKKF
ncbi:glycosyltransferase [Leuconostoc gelidum subsp. gasicomitatum]|uniref:glycosyltransferase n=1 Tax=Leuconostoc gasicomitatum TaxID=115778 RepID=UPI001CC73008|nr:glycosyltransferase [Leuconostoc gasicomitatum]MBZ5961164.1 glycosyltransferase [Leuconostoc gasicomitatum]MBZ5993595.1 glycosyltransferase [Leuconostoc gasicomitatum]